MQRTPGGLCCTVLRRAALLSTSPFALGRVFLDVVANCNRKVCMVVVCMAGETSGCRCFPVRHVSACRTTTRGRWMTAFPLDLDALSRPGLAALDLANQCKAGGIHNSTKYRQGDGMGPDALTLYSSDPALPCPALPCRPCRPCQARGRPQQRRAGGVGACMIGAVV